MRKRFAIRKMVVMLLVSGFTAYFIQACEPQLTDEPIPWQAFPEIELNLSFPDNSALRLDGGLKEVNNGGVRGIIVYRLNSTTFHAYERNCSFQPNEAGATINIHTSKLYFIDHR